MEVRRGDVVLVVAPGDLGKPRPGVVVQSDDLGATTSSVLVCPMSSDLSEFRRTRPHVEPSSGNGLLARTQIMTDKINALRRDRIRRVIGALDAHDADELDRALLIVLGLAR